MLSFFESVTLQVGLMVPKDVIHSSKRMVVGLILVLNVVLMSNVVIFFVWKALVGVLLGQLNNFETIETHSS